MRTLTDRSSPIGNTTFYATLIINSNIGHADYMQPRCFFSVNRPGRYFEGDAPNGLAEVRPAPSTAAAWRRRGHRTGPEASTTGSVRGSFARCGR